MKKTIRLRNLVLAGFLGVCAFQVQAQDIRLGQPGYGGTGCPGGTVSATLSPDKKSLSLIFDQYVASAGGNTGRAIDRKTCNIAVPVHIPQGISISVIDVDYRGYIFLPAGGRGSFTAEYFFAGVRGPQYQKDFVGPTDKNYTFSNTLGVEARIWSACGQDVNLRVNSAMMVRNSNRSVEALGTVDTADFKAGIVYKIAWKSCNKDAGSFEEDEVDLELI